MTAEQLALSQKIARLRRELGPLIMNALENPRVVEIMLNPDSKVWIEEMGKGLYEAGSLDAVSAESAMKSIAAMTGKDLSKDLVLECQLPMFSARFAGSLPPVAVAPTFAIRKRATSVFTLEQYVESGILSKEAFDVLIRAVDHRKNVLVVGGTGSGKTTFLNAVLAAISKYDEQRVVIIEDTPELQCTAKNKVELLTTAEISMQHLLKFTLRMRPDRIVLGEVRGQEALALLKAWNTGHSGGCATVHANNCRAGLQRLEQLVQEAGVPPQPNLIAEAINFVVHIRRTSTGREIAEVIEVISHDQTSGEYKYKTWFKKPELD